MKELKQLEQFFSKKKEVLLAYLFGSRVSKKTGPLSDYDIAILTEGKREFSFRFLMMHELSRLLETAKIDLVILNSAPIELRYNIVAQGTMIYQQSEFVKVEFEANTLSLYFDYLPFLRQRKKEIIYGEDYETGIQRYREAFGKTQKLLAKIKSRSKQTD